MVIFNYGKIYVGKPNKEDSTIDREIYLKTV